jgi:hypothetical protein
LKAPVDDEQPPKAKAQFIRKIEKQQIDFTDGSPPISAQRINNLTNGRNNSGAQKSSIFLGPIN